MSKGEESVSGRPSRGRQGLTRDKGEEQRSSTDRGAPRCRARPGVEVAGRPSTEAPPPRWAAPPTPWGWAAPRSDLAPAQRGRGPTHTSPLRRRWEPPHSLLPHTSPRPRRLAQRLASAQPDHERGASRRTGRRVGEKTGCMTAPAVVSCASTALEYLPHMPLRNPRTLPPTVALSAGTGWP